MGRVRYAAKNIAWGYIGSIATAVMGFVLKQVFIAHLNATLLGVNGLYTGILSLLNMAELGIGTALNVSLYAPVARGDTEKIKSYMQMYRKAYHVIAFTVAVIGLALTPFLGVFIRKPGDNTPRDLMLYYFIFLFNTVSSYFVAYKYSLVNAEQKNYIQTNINTVTKIISYALQIAVLIFTENFYCYLLTDCAVQLLQKIYVSRFLDRRYPYLTDKKITPLSKEESGEVWKQTGALVWHKVGDVARLQTDSIIISSFIEVALVGVVDNYNLVINTVSSFVNTIFNSLISGFGNLIATESKQKQYDMFCVYRFFASWIYGYSAVGFFILLTPFVRLWLGDGWILSAASVYLILMDYYFKGERVVLSNYKTAAGVFEQDKYLAVIQGIVNLVLSIWLVIRIGLPGVYIGTVVSGLIANITKPVIIYHVCFDKKAWHYFADAAKHLAVTVALFFILNPLCGKILGKLSLFSFLLAAVLVTVIYNGVFVLLFHRTQEFGYLYSLLKKRIRRAA